MPWRAKSALQNSTNAKTLSYFVPVETNSRLAVPRTAGFPPFSRELPWPNRKFVASHSEYAYFGTSTVLATGAVDHDRSVQRGS